MHSPQWLRTYMSHLGLLLPALDALWVYYEVPPYAQIRKLIEQRISTSGITPSTGPKCSSEYPAARISLQEQRSALWIYANIEYWGINQGLLHCRSGPCYSLAHWTSTMLAALDAHLCTI